METALPNQLAPSSWTDHVFRAVAELREQNTGLSSKLDAVQREDLGRLMSAAATLDTLLDGADTDKARRDHDIRNTLGAMRGYAELLLSGLEPLFPPMQAALERVLKAVATATDDSAPERIKPLASGAAGTVLVVDDSADNRDLLNRYLTPAGHTVLLAGAGAEALALLEQHAVDLVLLDLIMPGLDGGAVLRRIKENEVWHAIPVIVISGRQDRAGVISCIEAGADDYLFKPFNPVLLQARIQAGLARKRWHDREDQYRQQLELNQQFIRATFGRYVSAEVVEDLLEKPEGLKLGGDVREVTMLMSDIRQFSSICENLAPDQLMKMLNNYLGTMAEIIIAHQGTINEFIGDAILAIFGAPISRADDADRAVQCALAMQQAIIAINRDHSASGLPKISMGIGLNTGAVIAGNIGCEQRSKYGVVGHHVNLTARIEAQAGGGAVLVSQSTLDKLRGKFSLGPRRQAQLKGIAEAVSIYPILAAAGVEK